MVSGVAQFGLVMALFQVLIIAGFAGYLQHRRPVSTASAKRRVFILIGGGAILIVLGWAISFGSLVYPWDSTEPLVAVRRTAELTEIGTGIVFLGYLGVIGGFVGHLWIGGN